MFDIKPLRKASRFTFYYSVCCRGLTCRITLYRFNRDGLERVGSIPDCRISETVERAYLFISQKFKYRLLSDSEFYSKSVVLIKL